jgi:Spindle and kinetochore-associated protein 2
MPPNASSGPTLTDLVQALEGANSALRGVATRLEAEFDRVYCSSRGPTSASLNPARLAARLAALTAAAPAAADAVLAHAHRHLEVARSARADTFAARRAVERVAAAVRAGAHRDDDEDSEGEVDRLIVEKEDRDADAELERLCERLDALTKSTQIAHRELVVAKTPADALLSDDDLDLALLRAGLSSGCESPSDQQQGPAARKLDSGNSNCSSGNNATINKSTGSGTVRPKLAWGPPATKTRPVRTKAAPIESANKENAPAISQQQPQSRTLNQRPASGCNFPLVVPDEFAPISKAAYQRLPRTLRQQAKLDQLNETYGKAFAALAKARHPLSESELLAATGEESIDTIDVLRRGFSVVKKTNSTWELGAAPAKA